MSLHDQGRELELLEELAQERQTVQDVKHQLHALRAALEHIQTMVCPALPGATSSLPCKIMGRDV